MMICSYIFGSIMILCIVLAIIVFFVFDVRKAWKVVTNKQLPLLVQGQNVEERLTQKISTTDLLKKDMLEKSIAMQLDNATTLLINQQVGKRHERLIMDVTYIYTDIVL